MTRYGLAEEVFKKHYSLLFTIANRIMENEQAAEDVVQDAFLYVLSGKEYNLNAAENMRAVLITIIKWIAYAHIKRQNIGIAIIKKLKNLADVKYTQKSSCEYYPILKEIMINISKLVPNQKAVIEQFYLEEKPLKEIRMPNAKNSNADNVKREALKNLKGGCVKNYKPFIGIKENTGKILELAEKGWRVKLIASELNIPVTQVYDRIAYYKAKANKSNTGH